MNAVKAKRGKLAHATGDARTTCCDRSCDGWIVLDFDPIKTPEKLTCETCLDTVKDMWLN